MANHKSSERRIRSTKTKRESNKYHAKTVRNAVKSIRTNAASEESPAKLPEVISMIDKLAKKTVIHKNKAANLKSKLMKKIKVAPKAKAK
jgi:small subunit ribosomal protein S20